ncbi:MAG TPA: hypothetical protein VFJ24_09510 [Gaiellales bacterium]|nr:hypothetical protein [Gaiellales bacterium]
MVPANEQRFWWIYHEYVDRPGGDYAELLRRGTVSSPDGVDVEAWRSDIRRKARQDKVSVSTSRAGDRAFAIVNKTITGDQEHEVSAVEFDRYIAVRELRNHAALLGHELVGWIRHDVESISLCSHCGARLYARTDSQPIEDGEALTQSCPGRAPVDLSEVP